MAKKVIYTMLDASNEARFAREPIDCCKLCFTEEGMSFDLVKTQIPLMKSI